MADPKNERSASAELEALKARVAEQQADLAKLKAESAAKDALISKQGDDLKAASALLAEEKPLAEIHGTGKCIAVDGCAFTNMSGKRQDARKGEVIDPCKEDLASLKSQGAIVLT